MVVGARCLVIRGGQALVIPASLATAEELRAGVADLEALCNNVANDYLQRRRAYLTDDDHAELQSFLMLAAWTEAGRYTGTYGWLVGYLKTRLQFRCTDWYRTKYGRKKRERPELLSLDALRAQELLDVDCA